MAWSRGHQVREHPCKLGKLAIFYHARKRIIKITFSNVFTSKKRLDRINPPPSKLGLIKSMFFCPLEVRNAKKNPFSLKLLSKEKTFYSMFKKLIMFHKLDFESFRGQKFYSYAFSKFTSIPHFLYVFTTNYLKI